jgi:uncharacterized protein YbjT (DUF2867 family)
MATREHRRILITGAAGNAGRLFLAEFQRRAIPVRALVRNPERAHGLPAGAQVVTGDMNRPDTLAPALEGVETAVLISSADERMRETQCSFVDAAKRAGVRRIVKFSGQEAGRGFDPGKFRFTRMHEEIEDHIESSGLRWTHLRPSQFMQVFLREAGSVKERGVLALPLGDIELAPVDLADVAAIGAAAALARDLDGHSLRITGPEALTARAVANTLSEVLGRPIEYVSLGIEERSRRLREAGTPAAFVDALAEQAAERLLHPQAEVHIEAHTRFGVQPTTFRDFLSRHADLFAR